MISRNTQTTDNREPKKHPTVREADGCFYCRSIRMRMEGDFCYCTVCPLFESFDTDDKGQKMVICCYAEDDKKEFPDYLPVDCTDEGKLLVQKAIQYAADAHKGAYRKGNSLPYIIHPMEVMVLVSRMTDEADVIAAAALHDVIEDTPRTAEDIREVFGERVAQLVDMESENKRPDRPKSETWRIRKEETLSHDKDLPLEAKYIMLADKLSNMRATERDFEKDGHAIWQKFNMTDEAQQEWYYRAVADVLRDLSDEPLYREYVRIVDKIFAK